eukprot:CAMPEP_0196223824 /NCGR_PEP_ID=MMETSP0912-20130531/47462_1 /TAXON_ID=49265 /ORGANISM="Thalassiosira rotula, Strain GSO102" /LENGTH=49 /DNA_ID=CAMNT_0041502961 /DNA_START=77 /DNA_END=226 /DNA_ORIENTATION=-
MCSVMLIITTDENINDRAAEVFHADCVTLDVNADAKAVSLPMVVAAPLF